MKKTTITLLALIVIIIGFLFWRHYALNFQSVNVAVGNHDSDLSEEKSFSGKVLILLVDGTEVYAGKDKIPEGAMEDYVLKTMELNKVKQVAIVASISARYGDVVALMDRLRKRQIRVMTVSTRPVSVGTRLPTFDWP